MYLSSWFPYPPDNGSRQRAFYLLRELAKRHEISLVAFYDPDQNPPQADALREFCTNIITLPRKIFSPQGARAFGAFFSSRPRSVASTFDPNIHAQIHALAARENYDAVLVGELSMAPYARDLSARAKILDDVEASVFESHYRAAHGTARMRAGLMWWKFKRYIQTLAPQFDALTVVSAREKALLQEMGLPREKIFLAPNGVDCQAARAVNAAREPLSCIYNGALTFAPNLDAMRYFVREILPLVREAEPRAHLRITGRADQVAQNELCEDNVVSFTGYLPDVKPLVAASAVCVVPLRVGGGTRLKILEAMALGTPVVASSKGAEGLDVQHNVHLLIADTPRAFADAILELFHQPNLAERLSAAAQQHVCAQYDWTHIAQQFDRLLVERVQK